jgi:hypothetical protein
MDKINRLVRPSGKAGLAAILGLLAAALVVVLVLERQSGLALRSRVLQLVQGHQNLPPLTLVQPYALASPQTYASITLHPLFTSSRQPQQLATQASAPVEQDLELTGVFINAKNAVALVKDRHTGQTQRIFFPEKDGSTQVVPVFTPGSESPVRPWGRLGGNTSPPNLQIEQVQPTSVVIRQAGNTAKLELQVALSHKQLSSAAPPPSVPLVVPEQRGAQPNEPKPAAGLPAAGLPTPASKVIRVNGAEIPVDQLPRVNEIRKKLGLPPLAP